MVVSSLCMGHAIHLCETVVSVPNTSSHPTLVVAVLRLQPSKCRDPLKSRVPLLDTVLLWPH